MRCERPSVEGSEEGARRERRDELGSALQVISSSMNVKEVRTLVGTPDGVETSPDLPDAPKSDSEASELKECSRRICPPLE